MFAIFIFNHLQVQQTSQGNMFFVRERQTTISNHIVFLLQIYSLPTWIKSSRLFFPLRLRMWILVIVSDFCIKICISYIYNYIKYIYIYILYITKNPQISWPKNLVELHVVGLQVLLPIFDPLPKEEEHTCHWSYKLVICGDFIPHRIHVWHMDLHVP